MTKADLVEKVANEADMTKKDAEQLVEIQGLRGGLANFEKEVEEFSPLPEPHFGLSGWHYDWPSVSVKGKRAACLES